MLANYVSEKSLVLGLKAKSKTRAICDVHGAFNQTIITTVQSKVEVEEHLRDTRDHPIEKSSHSRVYFFTRSIINLSSNYPR